MKKTKNYRKPTRINNVLGNKNEKIKNSQKTKLEILRTSLSNKKMNADE